MEQEQPNTPREPSSTPSPEEQEMEQDMPRELPPTPTLLRGSSTTREQSLVQLEITTFMNPAPREQDWSTQQNLVASSLRDHPATICSSGGSLSKEAGVGLEHLVEGTEQFENGLDCADGISSNAPRLEGRGMIRNVDEDDQLREGIDQGRKKFVQKLAPSMNSEQKGASRKSLDGDTVAGLTRSSSTKVANNSKQECVFKRVYQT